MWCGVAMADLEERGESGEGPPHTPLAGACGGLDSLEVVLAAAPLSTEDRVRGKRQPQQRDVVAVKSPGETS